jgi:hypothetical protein
MNLLLVVAALLLARVIIEFFGHLGTVALATETMRLTGPLVLPVGLGRIVSPYRGVFDLDAAATLGIVLAFEWVVAFVRRLAR